MLSRENLHGGGSGGPACWRARARLAGGDGVAAILAFCMAGLLRCHRVIPAPEPRLTVVFTWRRCCVKYTVRRRFMVNGVSRVACAGTERASVCGTRRPARTLKWPENRVAANQSSTLRHDGLAGQRCADDMPSMIFQPANRLGPDRLTALVPKADGNADWPCWRLLEWLAKPQVRTGKFLIRHAPGIEKAGFVGDS